VPSIETAAISFLRRIRMGLSKKGILQVKGVLSEEVVAYLQNRKRKDLARMELRYGLEITLQGDPSLPPDGGVLEFIKEEQSPIPRV
jgi:ribonuclease E